MLRRFMIPILGSALLLAATAGSALAKCEVPDPPPFCSQVLADIVTPASGYSPIRAGLDKSVQVMVSRGEQPFEARSVTLTFTGPGGEAVMATATPAGTPGMWTADIRLPEKGSWDVGARVVGIDGVASDVQIAPVWVTPGPIAPPDTTPVTPPVTPPPPAAPTVPLLMIGALIAGIAGAGLVGRAARIRGRRRAAAAE